jgi:hypothetical protein
LSQNENLISIGRSPSIKPLTIRNCAGICRNYETVHFRRDGSAINIIANSAILERDGRKVVLSIDRDDTERISAQAERERLIAELSCTAVAAQPIAILTSGRSGRGGTPSEREGRLSNELGDRSRIRNQAPGER